MGSDWLYQPPRGLGYGLTMTVYAALVTNSRWQKTLQIPEPSYRSVQLLGADAVPLHGWIAIPPNPKGTLIATYGITGELSNQGMLRSLGTKAYHQGYAVVLFDWRAHGRSAQLSPTLTSDGLYEGADFVHIAAQAIALGCPALIWFAGYSLGGQLALWGLKAATDAELLAKLALTPEMIRGGAVVCPNLDAWRSLHYLMAHPLGRHLERRIAQSLKQLAYQLHAAHPEQFDLAAIDRADSILAFDRELVIERLGFSTVKDYYEASSPFQFLRHLQKPALILYAADDPLFDPSIVPDLQRVSQHNSQLRLALTAQGGHVGYISSRANQIELNDPDCWWAWNRTLDWMNEQI